MWTLSRKYGIKGDRLLIFFPAVFLSNNPVQARTPDFSVASSQTDVGNSFIPLVSLYPQ